MKTSSPDRLHVRRLETMRAGAHPHCVVCSVANRGGLGQEFALRSDGSVASTFVGNEAFEGYSGLLHGGMAAALLDGAMTNCLFAHGIRAFTAELKVRYRRPVLATGRIDVRGWLQESHGRLHLLAAELCQDSQVKVTALGKFMECHE